MQKPEIHVIKNELYNLYEVRIWDGKNGTIIHSSYDKDNAVNEAHMHASNMQWKLKVDAE